MKEELHLESILILSLLAFVTPLFVYKLKRLKIPYQVGEIFVGILVGKSFLNIIQSDSNILLLYDLGLAFLMFLSGLEIDFGDVKGDEKSSSRKLLQSFLMFGLSVVISYLLVRYMPGIGIEKGYLFFSLIFAASAPGLLVPLLKQKKIISSDFGQVVLIFSLICEFICLIGFTVISSTMSYGISYKSFLFLIIFAAAFLLYLAIKKVNHHIDFTLAKFGDLHLGVRAAFALMLILVTISDKVGSDIVLGSFLAGVIFSLVSGKAKEDLSHQLDIVGYGFLIPIFFIMVGVNLDLKVVFTEPKALAKIPIFLLVFFLVKFIPFMFMRNKCGFNKALSASFLLSAQLTLIIVGAQMALDLDLINEIDYSTFIVTTVISCILFPILFEHIYKMDSPEGVEEIPTSEKIVIREITPTNKAYLNIPLKDLEFPPNCRFFLIIRNHREIMPNANTVLREHDCVVLAGLLESVDRAIELMEGI